MRITGATATSSHEGSGPRRDGVEMMDESQSRPVTLVVAHGRPLLLRSLEYVCAAEPGFEVVATSARGDATLDALRAWKPHVLILDAILPPSGGLWVLRQMRREKLATRAVLLADNPGDRSVVDAVRLGVGGVLFPDMTPESLVRCLRTVHAGQQWLEDHAIARLLNRRSGGQTALRQLGGSLTRRQLEIVRLATEAIPAREIAARLMVTEGTVKVHLHNIYQKLQVDGRVGLVRLAMKRGLLQIVLATPVFSP